MSRDYLNKKEYNKWLNTLQKHIETTLKENGANYEVVPSVNGEATIHYNICDVPNIGNFTIGVEPYECAKAYHGRGVRILSIFTRFDTFRDNDKRLPYQDNLNHFSGKYNFSSFYGEANNLLTAFSIALQAIFDISNKN